jgi:hypothetical protein
MKYVEQVEEKQAIKIDGSSELFEGMAKLVEGLNNADKD